MVGQVGWLGVCCGSGPKSAHETGRVSVTRNRRAEDPCDVEPIRRHHAASKLTHSTLWEVKRDLEPVVETQ